VIQTGVLFLLPWEPLRINLPTVYLAFNNTVYLSFSTGLCGFEIILNTKKIMLIIFGVLKYWNQSAVLNLQLSIIEKTSAANRQ